MIQEKEFDQIPKCLEEAQLIPKGLWEMLEHKPIGLGISGFVKNGTDTISYRVEVEQNTNLGVYTLEGFKSTLLHIGDINHSDVEGIDTAGIERAMKSIDWRQVLPEALKDNPTVLEVNRQLGRLHATKNEQGMEIAELLALKYFTGTPLELVINFSEQRQKFETSLFVEINNNVQDLNFSESYHLLCGRGVAKPMSPDQRNDVLCWLIMEEGKVIPVADFDLGKSLASLPFDQLKSIVRQAEDIANLTAGNQVMGKFRVEGRVFHAHYEADPRKGLVALRDLDQNSIDLQKLRARPELIAALPRKDRQERKGLGL